jgi:hypothetical protein
MRIKLIVAIAITMCADICLSAPSKETIKLEAENAILANPMVIQHDLKAASDLFINSLSTGGYADFHFNTSLSSGVYSVWMRVIATDGSDSVKLFVDENYVVSFDAAVVSDSWQWVVVMRNANLSKGLHFLRVQTVDANFKIDQIVVTNDFNTTAISLSGIPLFHSCPRLIGEDVPDKCIENIVQYKIAPIYKSNVSSMTKCVEINKIMNEEIEPYLTNSNIQHRKQIWDTCESCTIREIYDGCPWVPVQVSTP